MAREPRAYRMADVMTDSMVDDLDASTVDDRADQIRAEYLAGLGRARTADGSLVRFHLEDADLDHARYVYRAVVDSDMNLQRYRKQLYEFVSRDDPTQGDLGKAELDADKRIRYQHGSSDGRPLFTYLMRKRRDWAEQDRQRDQREKVDFLEAGRGLTKSKIGVEAKQSAEVTPSDAGPGAYVPRK